ncbi:zinc c3hc4 type (ring finger) domain-containing protein [Cystoisospora suis]|uniref:Zinc c3hc4 type (Ring finger) domain-containing protein n=1 Tax=Cystoisospora suis TaxID=483139 RepID=A0A2C6L9V9_9APIC|nr:zinc c3hc4 type (ring finger) domain-containing protein [Cystoisospora suis]
MPNRMIFIDVDDENPTEAQAGEYPSFLSAGRARRGEEEDDDRRERRPPFSSSSSLAARENNSNDAERRGEISNIEKRREEVRGRGRRRKGEKDEEDEEDEWINRGGSRCSICYLSLIKDIAALTGCGHTFHSACIEKWFKQRGGRSQKPTCPYCAKEYPSQGRRSILSIHLDLPDFSSSSINSATDQNEDPAITIARLTAELAGERRKREEGENEIQQHALQVAKLEAREDELLRFWSIEEEEKKKCMKRIDILTATLREEEERRENSSRAYEENRKALEEKFSILNKKYHTLKILASVIQEEDVHSEKEEILEKLKRLPGLTSEEKLQRMVPLVEFLRRAQASKQEEIKKLKKEKYDKRHTQSLLLLSLREED